eukprot:gene21171-28067_t
MAGAYGACVPGTENDAARTYVCPGSEHRRGRRCVRGRQGRSQTAQELFVGARSKEARSCVRGQGAKKQGAEQRSIELVAWGQGARKQGAVERGHGAKTQELCAGAQRIKTCGGRGEEARRLCAVGQEHRSKELCAGERSKEARSCVRGQGAKKQGSVGRGHGAKEAGSCLARARRAKKHGAVAGAGERSKALCAGHGDQSSTGLSTGAGRKKTKAALLWRRGKAQSGHRHVSGATGKKTPALCAGEGAKQQGACRAGEQEQEARKLWRGQGDKSSKSCVRSEGEKRSKGGVWGPRRKNKELCAGARSKEVRSWVARAREPKKTSKSLSKGSRRSNAVCAGARSKEARSCVQGQGAKKQGAVLARGQRIKEARERVQGNRCVCWDARSKEAKERCAGGKAQQTSKECVWGK